MIKLEYTFANHAELKAFLAGDTVKHEKTVAEAVRVAQFDGDVVGVPLVAEKPKAKRKSRAKKKTSEVSAEQTAEAFPKVDAPAEVAVTEVADTSVIEPILEAAGIVPEPTVDDVKAAILKWAGDGADQMVRVKGFLSSCGVERIGLMTGDMRADAVAKLAKGFVLEADPLA